MYAPDFMIVFQIMNGIATYNIVVKIFDAFVPFFLSDITKELPVQKDPLFINWKSHTWNKQRKKIN